MGHRAWSWSSAPRIGFRSRVLCLAISLACMVFMSVIHLWSYTYVDGGLPDERLMELHAAKLGYVDYTGPISRCPGLITLEESLNTEPVVGACYHSKPLLPGLPTRYCEPLPCLWSYNLMTNIDVWLDAFSVLPDALLHGRCPVPEGGQAAQSKHIKPEVAVILFVNNDDGQRQAGQALLETFRTSQELPSIEYITVYYENSITHSKGCTPTTRSGNKVYMHDNASKGPLQSITHIIKHVKVAFGVNFKLLLSSSCADAATSLRNAVQTGVRASTADYVMLITPLAILTHGSLYSLWRTLKDNTSIGMVGPLLLDRNGYIQSAGGIIHMDGALRHFAHGYHYTAAQVDFSRRVDYVPADSALLRREHFPDVLPMSVVDFQTLGAELAMTIYQKNNTVIYQPEAVAYMNSPVVKVDVAAPGLHARWSSVLNAVHCPANMPASVAANRHVHHHLLWIDDGVPEPDHDSGSVRAAWLLRILVSHGYAVSFQPRLDRPVQYTQLLRFYGIHVLPARTPSQLVLQFDDGSCWYHGFIISRPDNYKEYSPVIKAACPRAPVIYDTVDVHFLREARAMLLEAAQGSDAWETHRTQPEAIKLWLQRTDIAALQVAARRDQEIGQMRSSSVTLVVRASLAPAKTYECFVLPQETF